MFHNRKRLIIIICIIVILSAGAFVYGSGMITDMTGRTQTESAESCLLSDAPEGTQADKEPAENAIDTEHDETSDVPADTSGIGNENADIHEADSPAYDKPVTDTAVIQDKDMSADKNNDNVNINVSSSVKEKAVSPKQADPDPEVRQQIPAAEAQKNEHACTFSISCSNAVKSPALSEDIRSFMPEDGWVLKPQNIEFNEGDTVFDLLRSVCMQNGIRMEFSYSPVYKNAYIEGINDLYEFDCGEMSGWMYKVNDIFPNCGCSQYVLKSGDTVCWVYTCDMGKDTGGRNVVDK